MCEIVAFSLDSDAEFATLEPWARELERYGIAGFGWGVAWIEDGRVRAYRSPGALRDDDEGIERLRRVRSTRFLVHLRRPSRLSTVQLADTQPFVDDWSSFAFAHNGLFKRHLEHRDRFAAVLRGRADSEVGFRLFEELSRTLPAPEALTEVHRVLGGGANLAVLASNGELAVYSGNHENETWTFRLGDARAAATGLHSDDQSLFDLVFPDAEDRRLVEGPIGLNGTVRHDTANLANGRSAGERSEHRAIDSGGRASYKRTAARGG